MSAWLPILYESRKIFPKIGAFDPHWFFPLCWLLTSLLTEESQGELKRFPYFQETEQLLLATMQNVQRICTSFLNLRSEDFLCPKWAKVSYQTAVRKSEMRWHHEKAQPHPLWRSGSGRHQSDIGTPGRPPFWIFSLEIRNTIDVAMV